MFRWTRYHIELALLYGADLRGADLRHANLSGADLRGADLSDANLSGSDLSDADLSDANLSDANLRGANLSHANLSGSDLSDADLSGANLSHANLSGSTGSSLALAKCSHLPSCGSIVGWKKLHNGLAKLLIPEHAMRSHGASRKCRASEAIVLELILDDDSGIGLSIHERGFEYRLGETVKPTRPFCKDRWDEYASGIHFFITREEAEAFQ